MKTVTAGSLAALLCATQSLARTEIAQQSSVAHFDIKTSGGNPRIIVQAKFNSHPMPMMVHSNAVFFAQLRHDQAKAFGIELKPNTHRSYGIDRGGHVSDLGRDDGSAKTLSIGRSVNTDAPVTIFEVPQNQYGMLGTRWITINRVIVDYGRLRVSVAPRISEASLRERELRRHGYIALPMTYDEKTEVYSVRATINGVTRRMTVATASAFSIDLAFAASASLALGKDEGHGSGPTGTHVPEYALASPVRVTIGNWNSPPIVKGTVQDVYGYSGTKRPSDANIADGGALGGAFLIKTKAVVDFGSRILFVKR